MEILIVGFSEGRDTDRAGVGGFVEHTIVSRAGVERVILREWPDRVGEKIDPFAAAMDAVA